MHCDGVPHRRGPRHTDVVPLLEGIISVCHCFLPPNPVAAWHAIQTKAVTPSEGHDAELVQVLLAVSFGIKA